MEALGDAVVFGEAPHGGDLVFPVVEGVAEGLEGAEGRGLQLADHGDQRASPQAGGYGPRGTLSDHRERFSARAGVAPEQKFIIMRRMEGTRNAGRQPHVCGVFDERTHNVPFVSARGR